MNLLFIAKYKFDPNQGGVQKISLTLAKYFADKEFKISFLSLTEGNNTSQEGMNFYFVKDQQNIDSKENFKIIQQILKQNNIHIIINQGCIYSDSIPLIKMIKSSNPGVFLITVFHNSIDAIYNNYKNIIQSNPHMSLSKFIMKFTGEKALKILSKKKYKRAFDDIISISDKFVLYFPQYIEEFEGIGVSIPHKKLEIIPNPSPYSVNRLALRLKKPSLLYVGRINKGQKRTERLIPIWKAINRKFPEWNLEVVGDGPDRIEIEEIAKEKKLERISFKGFQNPVPFYEKSKILLLTSDFEGYGMVLIEALAHGTVPVAFNSFSAIGEIISDEKNGILIQEKNVEEFISRLSDLMNDNKRLEDIAKNGFDSVLKFDLETIAEKWIQLFLNLR